MRAALVPDTPPPGFIRTRPLSAFSGLLLHAMRRLRPSELPLYALCEPPVAIDVPMQGVALVDSSGGGADTSSSLSDPLAASPGGSMTDRQYSLKNRHPQWDKELGCFLLNFNGRVSHSSRKNFQLVTVDEKVVMQFGKRGKNTFILDWGWPLTPIQAFGIALAVMDHSKKHFG